MQDQNSSKSTTDKEQDLEATSKSVTSDNTAPTSNSTPTEQGVEELVLSTEHEPKATAAGAAAATALASASADQELVQQQKQKQEQETSAPDSDPLNTPAFTQEATANSSTSSDSSTSNLSSSSAADKSASFAFAAASRGDCSDRGDRGGRSGRGGRGSNGRIGNYFGGRSSNYCNTPRNKAKNLQQVLFWLLMPLAIVWLVLGFLAQRQMVLLDSYAHDLSGASIPGIEVSDRLQKDMLRVAYHVDLIAQSMNVTVAYNNYVSLIDLIDDSALDQVPQVKEQLNSLRIKVDQLYQSKKELHYRTKQIFNTWLAFYASVENFCILTGQIGAIYEISLHDHSILMHGYSSLEKVVGTHVESLNRYIMPQCNIVFAHYKNHPDDISKYAQKSFIMPSRHSDNHAVGTASSIMADGATGSARTSALSDMDMPVDDSWVEVDRNRSSNKSALAETALPKNTNTQNAANSADDDMAGAAGVGASDTSSSHKVPYSMELQAAQDEVYTTAIAAQEAYDDFKRGFKTGPVDTSVLHGNVDLSVDSREPANELEMRLAQIASQVTDNSIAVNQDPSLHPDNLRGVLKGALSSNDTILREQLSAVSPVDYTTHSMGFATHGGSLASGHISEHDFSNPEVEKVNAVIDEALREAHAPSGNEYVAASSGGAGAGKDVANDDQALSSSINTTKMTRNEKYLFTCRTYVRSYEDLGKIRAAQKVAMKRFNYTYSEMLEAITSLNRLSASIAKKPVAMVAADVQHASSNMAILVVVLLMALVFSLLYTYVFLRRTFMRPTRRLLELVQEFSATYRVPDPREVSLKETQEIVATLQPMLENYRVLQQKNIDLEKLNTKLGKLYYIDGLTHMYNRQALDEVCVKSPNLPMRSAVLMVDIDHLSAYNMSKGRDAGDDALSLIANTIKANIAKDRDLIFRYGGNQFCVVLNHISYRETVDLCDRLLQTIEQLKLKYKSSAKNDNPLSSALSIIGVVSDSSQSSVAGLGVSASGNSSAGTNSVTVPATLLSVNGVASGKGSMADAVNAASTTTSVSASTNRAVSSLSAKVATNSSSQRGSLRLSISIGVSYVDDSLQSHTNKLSDHIVFALKALNITKRNGISMFHVYEVIPDLDDDEPSREQMSVADQKYFDAKKEAKGREYAAEQAQEAAQYAKRGGGNGSGRGDGTMDTATTVAAWADAGAGADATTAAQNVSRGGLGDGESSLDNFSFSNFYRDRSEIGQRTSSYDGRSRGNINSLVEDDDDHQPRGGSRSGSGFIFQEKASSLDDYVYDQNDGQIVKGESRGYHHAKRQRREP